MHLKLKMLTLQHFGLHTVYNLRTAYNYTAHERGPHMCVHAHLTLYYWA
jgi:hypothetical protein